MRKYFTAFIAFSFLAIVMTVICLVSFKPIDTLMKPPMSGGENRDIQLAFEETLNKGYKLRVPLSGNYRSSYISEDVNGDGQEETVVLYSTEDAVDLVKISFMMKVNNEWKVISSLESEYSEVHQVKFDDIDGDGIMEILIGLTLYNNDLSRQLNVYRLPVNGNGDFDKIYGSSYLRFDTVDIDSDYVSDIAIFEQSEDGIVLSSNVYSDGNIIRNASIQLDSSVYSVYNLSCDNGADNGALRMFVDSYKIDSGAITECVYWDKHSGKMDKVKVNGVSVLSSRFSGIPCQDVNYDGLIEIPVEVPLADSCIVTDNDSTTQIQNIIKWIQLDKNNFSTVTHQLIYSNNDFRITFNEKWLKNITVINDYTKNSIEFYSSKGATKTLLFELIYTSTQAEEDALSNKYKLLKETGKGKLFYIIYNSDRNLNINKVYIEKSIILYGG